MSTVVQDWTNYRESLLFKNSQDYFKQQGKAAFSENSDKKREAVPNALTNCYPQAKSIAKLLKANLESSGLKTMKVLECGAGAGVFARNFLTACDELGILDRIEYLISDYSRLSVEEIRDGEVLGEYKNRTNIKYLELDILNLETCKDINAADYKLEDIGFVIFNYVFCVLPVTVLAKDEKQSKLMELELKFSQEAQSYEFLEDLKVDFRWSPYQASTEHEQQYLPALEKHIEINYDKKFYYYAYGSLKALDNLLSCVNDDAAIYIADMPPLDKVAAPFKIYGSSVAHPINDGLVQQWVNANQLKSLRYLSEGYALMRILIFKNPEKDQAFFELFQEEFIDKNLAPKSLMLRAYLSELKSKDSHDLMRYLLDELASLDQQCYEYHYAEAKYHYAISENDKALDCLRRAISLDFLNNTGLAGKEVDAMGLISLLDASRGRKDDLEAAIQKSSIPESKSIFEYLTKELEGLQQ